MHVVLHVHVMGDALAFRRLERLVLRLRRRHDAAAAAAAGRKHSKHVGGLIGLRSAGARGGVPRGGKRGMR